MKSHLWNHITAFGIGALLIAFFVLSFQSYNQQTASLADAFSPLSSSMIYDIHIIQNTTSFRIVAGRDFLSESSSFRLSLLSNPRIPSGNLIESVFPYAYDSTGNEWNVIISPHTSLSSGQDLLTIRIDELDSKDIPLVESIWRYDGDVLEELTLSLSHQEWWEYH